MSTLDKKDNVGVVESSGKKCPISGIWEVVDEKRGAFFFKKDQYLPKFSGKSVEWVLN